MDPLTTLPGWLGWTLERELVGKGVEQYSAVRLVPEFPECAANLDKLGIAWDAVELQRSCCRPGGYQLLNSDTGYSPEVGIEERIFVSHPDPATVVWEIDAKGLSSALAPRWQGQQGFLRLTFSRTLYEAAIRSLLDAVVSAAAELPPAEELEPDNHGGALDLVRQFAADPAAWQPSPLLPSGSVVELGFLGADLYAINGVVQQDWPTRLFPRWSVFAAFERWLRFVGRRSGVAREPEALATATPAGPSRALLDGDPFVLLQESERAECAAAGEALAEALREAFAEGGTAPGVEVTYRCNELGQPPPSKRMV